MIKFKKMMRKNVYSAIALLIGGIFLLFMGIEITGSFVLGGVIVNIFGITSLVVSLVLFSKR